MKLTKAIALFCFFSFVLGSCFDPPEFPVTPEITFESVTFRHGRTDQHPDTLKIDLNFRDGDGDLGLSASDIRYRVAPYNYGTFFQTDGEGGLIPLATQPVTIYPGTASSQEIEYFNISDPDDGMLVFERTRFDPLYNTLPDFSCANYEPREFLIAKSDEAVLHEYSQIDTVLKDDLGNEYLVVFDTVYVESNPNHYNIEVDFLVENNPGTGDFQEFNWREIYCETFDGRFPVLSETETGLEGTLSYSMESFGFRILFENKKLKLRIRIRDRALNESNEITTPEFTLIQ